MLVSTSAHIPSILLARVDAIIPAHALSGKQEICLFRIFREIVFVASLCPSPYDIMFFLLCAFARMYIPIANSSSYWYDRRALLIGRK